MQPLQKQRPVFLNLLLIRFPVTAILSILHRISGVILVISFPLMMYLFAQSLQSESAYTQVQQFLTQGFGRIVVLLLLWSISHHFFAGIRYFLIDLEWIITRQSAGRSAWIVIVVSILVTAMLFLGVSR